MQDR
jgi:hypothetical protein